LYTAVEQDQVISMKRDVPRAEHVKFWRESTREIKSRGRNVQCRRFSAILVCHNANGVAHN
jgi:hypothetical protein